eukprot:CAMPEP_0206546166 /NCGR_PEP_ID=MMETSP0325_2-20121206/12545_1 /ASSEMBLY_ACC=CAM_ASM_000347 /TAXON_ID=2866 /ORGANISM="Crypthecodinium cohnii, Strain Seligo" /LENGTH=879 /DNA_ID=CAMNT_0054045241 /DNA_START=403 /DNA_END=3039 /DNA_ORIENTATION=+
MQFELLPLHVADAKPHKLPREGLFCIGRRDENDVVCNNLAVSGRHCYIVCANSEVVDCSSNGTYLNEVRLAKGRPKPLSDGDLLSLTKIAVGQGPSPPGPRVQFRVVASTGVDGFPGAAMAATRTTAAPAAVAATAATATIPMSHASLPATIAAEQGFFMGVTTATTAGAAAGATEDPNNDMRRGLEIDDDIPITQPVPDPNKENRDSRDNIDNKGCIDNKDTNNHNNTNNNNNSDYLSAHNRSSSEYLRSGLEEEDRLAHDILLQEQQSKAKVTAELLLVRRRLWEEGNRLQNLQKEAKKLKQQRSSDADTAKGQLSQEVESLRQQRSQLQKLQEEHQKAETDYANTNVELASQRQRAVNLEAVHDRLECEAAALRESLAAAEARTEELQTTLASVDATATANETDYQEAKGQLETMQAEIDNMKREVSTEKGQQEQRDDRFSLLQAEEEHCRTREKNARQLLDSNLSVCSELEGKIKNLREEVHREKENQMTSKRTEATMTARNQALRGLAATFMDSLRTFGEAWSNQLNESLPDVIEDPGEQNDGFDRPAASTNADVGRAEVSATMAPTLATDGGEIEAASDGGDGDDSEEDEEGKPQKVRRKSLVHDNLHDNDLDNKTHDEGGESEEEEEDDDDDEGDEECEQGGKGGANTKSKRKKRKSLVHDDPDSPMRRRDDPSVVVLSRGGPSSDEEEEKDAETRHHNNNNNNNINKEKEGHHGGNLALVVNTSSNNNNNNNNQDKKSSNIKMKMHRRIGNLSGSPEIGFFVGGDPLVDALEGRAGFPPNNITTLDSSQGSLGNAGDDLLAPDHHHQHQQQQQQPQYHQQQKQQQRLAAPGQGGGPGPEGFFGNSHQSGAGPFQDQGSPRIRAHADALGDA